MLSTNARKIHPTVPEKETEGVSLRKASTETFSLGPVHAKKRHKVPMPFHQRLLPNWQNRCDTSQLQLIRRTTRASQLSTFSAATHSSPAAAPGPWAHPPPPQSTQLHPGRWHGTPLARPWHRGASQLPADRGRGSKPGGGTQRGSFTSIPQLGGVQARAQAICLPHVLTMQVLGLYLFLRYSIYQDRLLFRGLLKHA